jgi:hypothetical protein
MKIIFWSNNLDSIWASSHLSLAVSSNAYNLLAHCPCSESVSTSPAQHRIRIILLDSPWKLWDLNNVGHVIWLADSLKNILVRIIGSISLLHLYEICHVCCHLRCLHCSLFGFLNGWVFLQQWSLSKLLLLLLGHTRLDLAVISSSKTTLGVFSIQRLIIS